MANNVLDMLLKEDSLKAISAKTGASTKEISEVLSQAIPSLLGGAQNQVKEAKSNGFEGALNQHATKDLSDVGLFFNNVDLDDGGKIVNHLLGKESTQETTRVAQKVGVSSVLTKSILSAVAPMIMSYLGKQYASSASNKKDKDLANLISSIAGKSAASAVASSIVSGIVGNIFKKD